MKYTVLKNILCTAVIAASFIAASFLLFTEAQAGKPAPNPTALLNGPWAAEPGQEITFSGADSSSPNGPIIYYCFSFGDASPDVCSSSDTTTHTYDNTGSYTVTLTVTDSISREDSGEDTATIVWGGADIQAPTNLVASERKQGKKYFHDLTWDTSIGASEYLVYESTNSSGPWSYKSTETVNSISYNIGGSSALFCYVVTASDAINPESGYSNWACSDGTTGETGFEPLAINTTTLPEGSVNGAYSQTLQAIGGTTPYIWSLTAGVLPSGLTLNGTTGLISGIPTQEEWQSFAVTVTDDVGDFVEQPLSITVGPELTDINKPTNLAVSERIKGKSYMHDLSWDPIAGATEYLVYESNDTTGTWTYKSTETTSSVSYNIGRNSTYTCYVVTASDGINPESAYSRWACSDGSLELDTYEGHISHYREIYGKSAEWEEWMLAYRYRYETAFERSRDLPSTLQFSFRYESAPIAYDPPWADEDEHMLALEALAEPAYPGYDFQFNFNGDIGSSYANVMGGIESITSHASGNWVYLYYESIFNHEFGHVMGINHHYTANDTIGQGQNFPPGESQCIMDRNSNQWCSACRTALHLPLDVDNDAEISDAGLNLLLRYPY